MKPLVIRGLCQPFSLQNNMTTRYAKLNAAAAVTGEIQSSVYGNPLDNLHASLEAAK
jgi:hypothetical protein